MKTIVMTKDIYQFDELDEDARQNALESLCDINTDYEMSMSLMLRVA